jgi:DNA-binding transcriptional LysR family regulator
MNKFESMTAFVNVVETGGFAAAARQLGMTRSAVNKSVIQLENELGVQLLQRTTRRVSPTDSGLAFYDRCVNILAAVEEAEIAVSQIHQEPKGSLRINAPMTFGILHLSGAIAQFMQQYPDVQVQLTLNDRYIDPIEEGFDVTIRISASQDFPGLIAHCLTDSAQVVCASPSYLKHHGNPSHPADLARHACLSYGHLATRDQWLFWENFTRHDKAIAVSIQSVLCSNNGDVLRQAAISGVGIAMLPSFIVGQDIQRDRLIQLLPTYHTTQLSIMVLYPPNRHLSTKVQVLTEFLQSYFSSMRFDALGLAENALESAE